MMYDAAASAAAIAAFLLMFEPHLPDATTVVGALQSRGSSPAYSLPNHPDDGAERNLG